MNLKVGINNYQGSKSKEVYRLKNELFSKLIILTSNLEKISFEQKPDYNLLINNLRDLVDVGKKLD